MSRIPERTMVWNGRGKRLLRDNINGTGKNIIGNVEDNRYSFGNPEQFKEMSEIVAQFNETQLALADSTGFGVFARSMLSLKFDEAFSVWLMGRVDCKRECITLPNGESVNMFPYDVNRVFGVPNNGLVPWHHTLDKSGKVLGKLEHMIGMTGSGKSCNAAAESFLRRCVDGSAVWDKDSFRVAFVIYIMSVISDPKRKSHFESQNFLPALVTPDQICQYDWARCILSDVITMCSQAKCDQKKKLTPCPPAGSLLFLTIFYLDNMDYGTKSIPSMVVPRINLFNAEVISRLIMADCAGLKGGPPSRIFGSGKPRSSAMVVYQRTGKTSSVEGGRFVKGQLPGNSSSSKFLKINDGEGNAEVAEQQVDMYTKVLVKAYKAKCLKHLTAARIAIEQEMDDLVSQLYRSSISRMGGSLARETTGKNQNTMPDQIKMNGMFSPPPTLSPEFEAKVGASTGFDFETPSFDLLGGDCSRLPEVVMLDSPCNSPPKKTRKRCATRVPLTVLKESTINARRAINEIDLNISSFTVLGEKKLASAGVFAKPTWKSVDGPERRNNLRAMQFYNWAVNEKKFDNSMWVDHGKPKKLEILGTDMIQQLKPGGKLEHNVVDAVTREIFQTESGCNGKRSKSVWRHFIETDFTRITLLDGDYLHASSVRDQFVGDHICHDMSQCQLVLMLAEIENKWTGLAWDFKRRQITCFAPGHLPVAGVEGWNVHTRAIDKLHAALESCVRNYFDGWQVNWDTWPKVLLRCESKLQPDPNGCCPESGVLALQFVRTFDGVVHRADLSEVMGTTSAREEILYGVMHLSDNAGVIPKKFLELAK